MGDELILVGRGLERIPVLGGRGGQISDVASKSVSWVDEWTGMKKKETSVTCSKDKVDETQCMWREMIGHSKNQLCIWEQGGLKTRNTDTFGNRKEIFKNMVKHT